ncbi:uncharacterized protein si:ch211-89o9.4 [Rhinichthys klamathensis goyatoka]|uniref:uncharacterized protein si:ch211-89o9.4 n=1 Tax=Rhinichthys klamathensis goyatoka TaxID=3034132 RepID=UPI0024B51528|nr:uncharacterized protein si:ch211-89o9.4 [Rhinichthys klamathensis goyatoka]
MKNSIQRKTTSSSTIAKANIHSHAPQINTRPVCLSQMSSVFTGVPPLFGTTQAFQLRLAQLEAQLVLNLISNIAAGKNSSYGNPLVPLSLLQPVGIQRSSFFNMYQPPGGFTLSHLLNSIPHRASYPSSSFTEINSVTANKESGDLLAKEINQEKIPIISNTKVPLPTSEKPLVRSRTNHLGKHFAFKPDVDCSRYQSMTAKAMISPDKPQIEEVETKQQATLHFPTENLSKALASLGLSFEDLELLSHFPDNQLTTEKLPFIIQDIQQRKETKGIYHGHARWNSSDQVESNAHGKHHDQRSIGEWQGSALPSPYGQSCPSSHSHRSLSAKRYSTSEDIHEHFSTQSRALKRLRDSSGSGSNSFLKRLQHGPADVTRGRPGSDCFPSRSKCSIRHSFVSTGCNKTRHYTTKRSLSSAHRSTTFNSMRNGQQQSFPVKSAKSEGTTESMNIQMPGTKMTEKTSAQTKGVIRVSGISLDYSESELIKMASPFSHPVEVLMATEVDMETCLEWKKALLMLPTEFSAQEMVKVYSAIPVHMRQQSLELVSQNVDLSSPVSVFHAFVGPSISNGLLTPLDHLLVVCNVPNQPCAATGVLRLIKPFGKVFRTLVFNGNNVDAEQCHWNKSSIQMVLEMESASVALSVFEWSHKIPCLYHNHHLSFLRGCDIQKDTSEVNSAKYPQSVSP